MSHLCDEEQIDLENIGTLVYRLMCRGHRDPEAFMAKVRSEYPTWVPSMGKTPIHIWFGEFPAEEESDYRVRYEEVPESSPGAFPVTYLDETDRRPAT